MNEEMKQKIKDLLVRLYEHQCNAEAISIIEETKEKTA